MACFFFRNCVGMKLSSSGLSEFLMTTLLCSAQGWRKDVNIFSWNACDSLWRMSLSLYCLSFKDQQEAQGRPNTIVMHPDFRMIVLANRPGFPFLGNDFFGALGTRTHTHTYTHRDTIQHIYSKVLFGHMFWSMFCDFFGRVSVLSHIKKQIHYMYDVCRLFYVN